MQIRQNIFKKNLQTSKQQFGIWQGLPDSYWQGLPDSYAAEICAGAGLCGCLDDWGWVGYALIGEGYEAVSGGI